MRIQLTLRHLAISAAAIGMVAAGGIGWAFAANGEDGPTPFLQHGTNGFPSPNNGAAVNIDEGLGGKGALLTSISGAPNEAGYGLVGVRPGGTFSSLSDVETQFNVTQGTCVGGAPRWVIDLKNPSNGQTQFLQVYFDSNAGHQPFGGCNAGAQQETNIINNPTTGWQVDQQNAFEPYALINATYGSWKVQDVEVVVDAGWDQGTQLNPNIQQVLLQKLKINDNTYFPLPSGTSQDSGQGNQNGG
jgi:hypothetical protein